jgi:hypothetical protein
MKYTDSYGNIVTRYIDHPQVVSKFFQTSNTIDTHNQLRQDLLQLEKKWRTKNPYYRLTTTLLGINVTDTYLLANHHRVVNYFGNRGEEKSIGIQRFAGMLSYQLLKDAKQFGSSNSSAPVYLPEICSFLEKVWYHQIYQPLQKIMISL